MSWLCVSNGTNAARFPYWRDPSNDWIPAMNDGGRGDTPTVRAFTESVTAYVTRVVIPSFRLEDQGIYQCRDTNGLVETIDIQIRDVTTTPQPPTTGKGEKIKILAEP